MLPSAGSLCCSSSPTQFKTLKDLVNYQDYAQVISANTGVFVIMPSGQVLHSPPQVNDAYQGLFQQVSDAFEALIIHQSQILALRLPPDDSTLPSSCELKLMAYGSSKQVNKIHWPAYECSGAPELVCTRNHSMLMCIMHIIMELVSDTVFSPVW